MTILIFVALLGWIPVCLGLFMALPARQAAVASVIGAWLLLPPASIPIAALPDYDKSMAAVIGIVLATLIFQPARLLKLRSHWFDLPILIWCLCPIATSLNNDLGLYDGLSTSLGNIVKWGLPYFIGRLYFGEQEGIRELTVGIVIGGLLCVLPCLYEMKMSPVLQGMVYGHQGYEGIRMGGYRPKLFFSTGLELGMWMTAVSLTVVWLWKSGSLKRIGPYSVGSVFLPILLVTTILCRSTGALILMTAGLMILWLCTRFNSKILLWALLLVAPLYFTARIPNYWTGKDLGELFRTYLGEERAHSFEYRLACENLLSAKARERPVWGWGGWGRSRVFNQYGQDIAPTDGMWIIYFGNFGFVGLLSWTTVLVLPSVLFVTRYPIRSWATPEVGPLVVLATLMSIYIIDCLMNGFYNLVYAVASGGLISSIPSTAQRLGLSRTSHDGLESMRAEPAVGSMAVDIPPPVTAQERLASRYLQLARTLKDQGQAGQAKAAWTHALTLLSDLASTSPGALAIQESRWSCANDFAWFLLSDPDAAEEDLHLALRLARQATQAEPENGAYWNTLGAAHYRAGDASGAIAAIERSIALGDGGTAFDYTFMALAHARRGRLEEARRWYIQATAWIEQHDSHHPGLLRLYDEAGEYLAPGDVPSSVS